MDFPPLSTWCSLAMQFLLTSLNYGNTIQETDTVNPALYACLDLLLTFGTALCRKQKDFYFLYADFSILPIVLEHFWL